jgi:opacity protein-like surface antigen
MKLICAAWGIAAMCAAGAAAQSTQTTEKSKVEVQGGKDVTVSGCLERNPDGNYVLTGIKTGEMRYALVTNEDLSKHVGHIVEVKGRATDQGDAKVKIENKEKTEGTSGTAKETESTHELKGNLPNMHYLGVKSVKTVADSCK